MSDKSICTTCQHARWLVGDHLSGKGAGFCIAPTPEWILKDYQPSKGLTNKIGGIKSCATFLAYDEGPTMTDITEKMREAAARVCEKRAKRLLDRANSDPLVPNRAGKRSRGCELLYAAAAIRALPLPADPRDAEIELLRAVLESVYEFISAEYGDPESQALEGEHVASVARPVWNKICDALAKAEEAE